MAYLTQRELQWAANQFGTGVRTTEDVEKQYQRIDREREAKRLCERCGAVKPIDQSCGCFDNGCQ